MEVGFRRPGGCSVDARGRTAQPLTEPSITPDTKYFWMNG